MQHFTSIQDLGPEGVARILNLAEAWKRSSPGKHLADKLLGMVFFNPSLRTRASFEAVMARGGGSAVVLEVGNGVWKLEDRNGVVMDGDRAEHVKEAVPVLSRYVDALAVRTFAEGKDDALDHLDPVMSAFRTYATVPVISMESAREHPCQGLADLLTVQETFQKTKGLPVTLTWAPHVKPLPKAVPNSFLLTAAAAGCHVRVAHPKGFELRPEVRAEAEAFAAATGGSVEYTHDQNAALEGSAVLYAKAWGPATDGPGGDVRQGGSTSESPSGDREHAKRAIGGGWMPGAAQMDLLHKDGIFLHCLPTRRNLEVADAILDGPRSRVVDEAENRYHVQRALLHHLIGRS